MEKDREGKAALCGRLKGGGLMALAGLWETWRSPAGERIRSFTIITTPPNELCAELHNRMPAVLKPETWPLGLGEQPAELAQVKALLAPYPSDGMICWPVSPRVGSVKNNDPSLVEPIVLSECARCGLQRPVIGLSVRSDQTNARSENRTSGGVARPDARALCRRRQLDARPLR
jgi:hypothetical protein